MRCSRAAARNHRFGLDDGVLIKDNHIALAGGVAAAVERAREAVGHLHKIEIEVSNENDLREAIKSGADILLLDNLAPEETARMVVVARELAPKVTLESSGGITLENVRAYAESGVDLISIGALTHSARAMDISFKIQPRMRSDELAISSVVDGVRYSSEHLRGCVVASLVIILSHQVLRGRLR